MALVVGNNPGVPVTIASPCLERHGKTKIKIMWIAECRNSRVMISQNFGNPGYELRIKNPDHVHWLIQEQSQFAKLSLPGKASICLSQIKQACLQISNGKPVAIMLKMFGSTINKIDSFKEIVKIRQPHLFDGFHGGEVQ